MSRVMLEDLRIGLKLNKPVFNLHGVLLLPAGEGLTAKHLGMLKSWGIREADVVLENGDEPETGIESQIPREIWHSAETEAAQRFRRVDTMGDPVLREIRRIVTHRLARRALLGGDRASAASA